jgi:hypothetical protein
MKKAEVIIDRSWNIIFLMYAYLENVYFDEDCIIRTDLVRSTVLRTLSITEEMELLFNDVIDAGYSTATNIFVIINSVNIANKNDHTSLYRLQENTGKKCELLRIEKLNNCNIQKPQGIITLFKRIESNYPAIQKILFTWGHGSIFGIFKEEENSAQASKESMTYNLHWADINSKGQPDLPLVKPTELNTLSKIKFRDILTNEEFAYCIAQGFKNGRADVLVMMNCCMMNINTAYALYRKNAAKYFIAPQGEIYYPAYNYRAVIQHIHLYLTISPILLARFVIHSIKALRIPEERVYFKKTETWSIICLNLENLSFFINIIKDLIPEIYKMCLDVDSSAFLKGSIDNCYKFDNLNVGVSRYMIDLRTLLFLLQEKSTVIRELYLAFESYLNDLVVDSFIGHRLFEPTGRQLPFANNLKPSGLSIYFPSETRFIEIEIFDAFIAGNAPSKSSFFQDFKWDEAVQHYLISRENLA